MKTEYYNEPGAQIGLPHIQPAAATAIDRAVLAGTGAAQPVGIVNTSGIGTTSGTSITHASICAMHQSVAEANGDDASIAYIATPAIRKLLSTRERASGSGFIWDGGIVDGQPAFVTTDAPVGGLICGYWPACVLGLWGNGVEIAGTRDEPGLFTKGTIQVRVFVHCDVAVTYAAAFNYSASVT